MTALTVIEAGPAMTLQDMGRPGWMAQGLSRGGAADLLALAEGAALLGQGTDCAALEMAGAGGMFETSAPLRIALTGAPMQAACDGQPLRWNASHSLPAGARVQIGGARDGVYGYLHVGGGFDGPVVMGARSAHLAGGVGRVVLRGDTLPLCPDPGGPLGLGLEVPPRGQGGEIRMLRGIQTDRFSDEMLERFQATSFRRSTRANRQGVALESDGPGFTAAGQLDVVSEVIVPGDIQMTGDGLPYVLLPECQTTGGYPRIGTVLPCDLPRVAQAGPGRILRFRLVTRDEADAAQTRHTAHLAALPRLAAPLLRRPEDIADLLSYQLIGGVVSATEEEGER
ncbi:MAG: biotin-dependent carboxyltransferase family protein [Rhodobacteraceae bacterium]|nr:biotin-dependent carboxyltransferase family protein [Paracoccaceae bacterium]